jgi:formiminotetrahydrofolate cyclodeaminase
MYKFSQQFILCCSFKQQTWIENHTECNKTTENMLKKKKKVQKATLQFLNNRHGYGTIQNAIKLPKTHKKGYRINKIADTSQMQGESTSLITYVRNIMYVIALLTQNL